MVHNPTVNCGLGSFPFARRYLENRCFFLFLRLLRCFRSPGCLLHGYLFTMRYPGIAPGEFPHSDICGSTVVCTYPQLFAACRVLRRLLVPRHPPYALFHLTYCLLKLRRTMLILPPAQSCISIYTPDALGRTIYALRNFRGAVHPVSFNFTVFSVASASVADFLLC